MLRINERKDWPFYVFIKEGNIYLTEFTNKTDTLKDFAINGYKNSEFTIIEP